jgi:hypothetical protein
MWKSSETIPLSFGFFHYTVLAKLYESNSGVLVRNRGPLQYAADPQHSIKVLKGILKGQSHEIFDLSFFSWINPTWVTDQQVKIFLHMVANSQRNSRICVDSALCRIARSRASPLCGIARSRTSPLCRIARSRASPPSAEPEKILSAFTEEAFKVTVFTIKSATGYLACLKAVK